MVIFKKNEIDKTNKSLWYCLETNFKNLDDYEFEQYVARLWRKKGYYVRQTPKGADQGVDLIAKKGKTVIIIQTKNWKGKVGNTDVLKTAGARQMFRAKYSQIVTSSTFTKSAQEAIKRSPRIRGTDIYALKKQFNRYFVIRKPIEKQSWWNVFKGKIQVKKSSKKRTSENTRNNAIMKPKPIKKRNSPKKYRRKRY